MATVPRTLTLDEEVARRLADSRRSRDRPMSRIVTKALPHTSRQQIRGRSDLPAPRMHGRP